MPAHLEVDGRPGHAVLHSEGFPGGGVANSRSLIVTIESEDFHEVGRVDVEGVHEDLCGGSVHLKFVGVVVRHEAKGVALVKREPRTINQFCDRAFDCKYKDQT